jgi:hypothetical protein
MSLTTGSVTFPDQQAIIDHINRSPFKTSINSKFMQNAFPGGIEKVAIQFANKIMNREEIRTNVKTAYANANENNKELDDLTDGLGKLLQGWKATDEKHSSSPNPDTVNIERLSEGLSEQKKMQDDIVFTIYENALLDVVDNATYTPPPGGPNALGSWTRHVQDLT